MGGLAGSGRLIMALLRFLYLQYSGIKIQLISAVTSVSVAWEVIASMTDAVSGWTEVCARLSGCEERFCGCRSHHSGGVRLCAAQVSCWMDPGSYRLQICKKIFSLRPHEHFELRALLPLLLPHQFQLVRIFASSRLTRSASPVSLPSAAASAVAGASLASLESIGMPAALAESLPSPISAPARAFCSGGGRRRSGLLCRQLLLSIVETLLHDRNL